MKKYALKYLQKNLSVIPVGNNKLPLIEWKEYQNRLPTREEIDIWWTKFPDANVGIVTGKISNITVVDVDAKSNGLETLKTLNLPLTLVAKTGGGGFHYYYNYSNQVHTTAGILEGIDIRNDGGYVVAPPSTHISGNCYEWSVKEDLIDFPKEKFPVKKEWDKIVGGVAEGGRNNNSASYIGKLMRTFPISDWDTVVWQQVVSWNSLNKPPMSERELRTTFDSIKRHAQVDHVNDVEEQKKKVKFLTFSEILERGKNELNNTNPKDIVSFGYDWLDERLTGVFPGELVVVGGETGTGKTTFTTNIIYRASKTRKCAIYALEDRLEDYAIKSIFFKLGQIKRKRDGVLGNYNWNDFRKNDIKDAKYKEDLEKAIQELKNENIEFADVGTQMNIDLLEELIENQVKNGVELFLVDHLHYFDLFSKDKSKADYIESVMTRIKTLQRRTGARIIMVVHYKKLNGQKPTIDSFKDSISIPQNANYVINLWRNREITDYADEKNKKELDEKKHYETIFFIPKARNPNGEGTIKVEFDPEIGDYKPLDNWQFGTDINSQEKESGIDSIEF